jgi:hypothetical protein
MRDLVMNPRLARRPLCPKRKLPIPFVQTVNEDGTADFTAIRDDLSALCGVERLCGLCGEPQEPGRMVFLGGPGSVMSRWFTDPPMHPECALDALSLCPHIQRPLLARRDSDTGTVPIGFHMGKPTRWCFYEVRTYDIRGIPSEDGGRVTGYHVPQPRALRWYTYADAQLIAEPPVVWDPVPSGTAPESTWTATVNGNELVVVCTGTDRTASPYVSLFNGHQLPGRNGLLAAAQRRLELEAWRPGSAAEMASGGSVPGGS